MQADPHTGKISKPYRLILSDQVTLRTHPVATHTDWSNSEYSNIKLNIKTYYSKDQRDFCVYCRCLINYKGYGEPIEHIIHKQHRPNWMFEPQNLALSCYNCNTKKSTRHTLKAGFRSATIFPNGSNFYRILHPHFDDFEAYILIEDNLIYKAISAGKGVTHIRFFQLNGETILMNRAKEKLLGKASIYKRLAHQVSNNSLSRLEKRNFRRVAKDLVHNYHLPGT